MRPFIAAGHAPSTPPPSGEVPTLRDFISAESAGSASFTETVNVGDTIILVYGTYSSGFALNVNGYGATWSEVRLQQNTGVSTQVFIGENCQADSPDITFSVNNPNFPIWHAFLFDGAVQVAAHDGRNLTAQTVHDASVAGLTTGAVYGIAVGAGAWGLNLITFDDPVWSETTNTPARTFFRTATHEFTTGMSAQKAQWTDLAQAQNSANIILALENTP